MSFLSQNIIENYAKEGIKMSELIQEWIDENYNLYYCQNTSKDIKYIHR